jgi:hypothetical protein
LLTALRALLIFAIVMVIAIARMAASITQHSEIHPVLIIIILVNSLIPIQWTKGKEVAWPVLLAAWRLNL